MTIFRDFEDRCSTIIHSIKAYLSRCHVKNADETDLRYEDKLHCLHTVCNSKATYLYADKKSGFDSIGKNELLLMPWKNSYMTIEVHTSILRIFSMQFACSTFLWNSEVRWLGKRTMLHTSKN